MKKFSFVKIKKLIYTVIAAVPLYYIYGYIGCPFRYFFGFSCGGCGITRALRAIIAGDFALAFEMNPLIYLVPIVAAVYFFRKRIPKKTMNVLTCIGITLAIVVYLLRLFSDNEVVYIDFKTGLIYKIIKSILQ